MIDKVIEDSKRFTLVIGYFPEAEIKFPLYKVINKEFGVVEFYHTSLHYVRSWMREYESLMDEFDKGPPPEDVDEHVPTLKFQ